MLALTQFFDRLSALVPPPRRHRHRYHGVLAPHAPLHAAVTARAGLPREGPVPERSLNAPLQAPAAAGTEKSCSPSAYQWAMWLARLYESQTQGGACLARPWMQVFPLVCFRSGEPMRIIAFVTDVGSLQRILAYLGEPAQAPRIAPAARGPPWQEHYDPREVDAFARSEPVPADEFDQRVSG